MGQDWITVTPNDDGIRPAGKPDQCFYCNRKVGELHDISCVTVLKIVKVKYTYEIDLRVPHHWRKQDFEFHRNESGWCAENAIDDIEEHLHKAGHNCACYVFHAEYIEDVDTTPHQRR